MVAGAPPLSAATDVDLPAEVAAREAAGLPRKDAIADVARTYGRPKRDVYAAVVAARQTP